MTRLPSVTTSLSTKERLNFCAVILDTIEQKRKQRQDPDLARNIERQIIDRELRELERDIEADPGALELQIGKWKNEKPARPD